MSDIAIRVEGLGKQYRIGGPQERYKTLRESLVWAARAWSRNSTDNTFCSSTTRK